ncbi:MBOAT family O-acyltransferase [Azospirillum argentinense]
MAFSSLDFLYLYIPAVMAVYSFTPPAARNAFILIASLSFYAFSEWQYTFVLLIYIAGNWAFGVAIQRTPKQSAMRRQITTFAVLSNLAGLIFFKYTGFIIHNINDLLFWTDWGTLADPRVHLPIGISFFAFQGISYVVDVSRSQVTAAKSLVTFGAYKAFFPQLIAGPIVRYKDVAADFSASRMPPQEEIAAGIRRFAVGLAKKVLIANTLAVPADAVFSAPVGSLSLEMVWYGSLCYALQIYFDFSGYSDMAIGLAQIFGIRIPENFRHPYTAATVREFWQRWHISLSTWFRDYLYIPLGGSRHGGIRTTLNLWCVFLLCGFWHGAEWTFIAWGAWHGAFLAIEHLFTVRVMANAWPLQIGGRVYTILVVLFGWVLFRSTDLGQAGELISVMTGFSIHARDVNTPLWLDLANWQVLTALTVGVIACTDLGHRATHYLSIGARNIAATVAFAMATIVLASSAFNPFIYFRF